MEATDTDVYLVIPLCSIALCLKINITVCFSFLIWSYLMFVMLNISEGKTDLHLSTHDGNEKRVWSIRWVAKWRNTQIPISAKCNTGYVSICVCVCTCLCGLALPVCHFQCLFIIHQELFHLVYYMIFQFANILAQYWSFMINQPLAVWLDTYIYTFDVYGKPPNCF